MEKEKIDLAAAHDQDHTAHNIDHAALAVEQKKHAEDHVLVRRLRSNQGTANRQTNTISSTNTRSGTYTLTISRANTYANHINKENH